MFAKQEDQTFNVLIIVLLSMKKGKIYSAKITLKGNGNVKRAYCGCQAGKDGRCNHVSASLFALETYGKAKESDNLENDEKPCTSKPCKWNIPSQKKIKTLPVRSGVH